MSEGVVPIPTRFMAATGGVVFWGKLLGTRGRGRVLNQSDKNNELFVREWANPHSWLLAADDLHEQALAQYRRRDGSVLLIKKDGETKSWDRVDKSIFLLGGFALENAIKAFLVYENPECGC